jgi:hypothetical protein
MTLPKAYDPEYGYMYQILVMFNTSREYEHCDYAKDKQEKNYLLGEYKLAWHSSNPTFKVIILPQKYWPVNNKNDL